MIQEQTLDQHRLYDEAAAWVARLLSDNVSQRDKQLFSNWLNLSHHHIKAFDELLETWDTTNAARYLFTEDDIGLGKSTHNSSQNLLQCFGSQLHGLLGSWQGVFALAGLTCLAVLIYAISLPTPSVSHPSQLYTTAAGEQKHIELPDGSVVELNTHSILRVSYRETARSLTLKQGEAYFSVMPNKQRPFIVDVGQGTVTAVGTAFNIYRKTQETVISVTEGVVGVREKKDAVTPNPASEQVKVNQEIRFNKRGLSNVKPTDLRRALSWREKTIIFDNIELPKAIAELNRYLEQPVNADDQSLAHLKVSGTFSLDAPDATLQALITSFNLKTEQSSPKAPLYLRIE